MQHTSRTPNGGAEKRFTRTSVFIPPKWLVELKVYAARHNSSLADILREAVRDWARAHDVQLPGVEAPAEPDAKSAAA